jgi:hypothetical protein
LVTVTVGSPPAASVTANVHVARAHPVVVTRKLPPLKPTVLVLVRNAVGAGLEIGVRGVPPKTKTPPTRRTSSACCPGPVKVSDVGTVKKPTCVGVARATRASCRWKAPLPRSVIWMMAVWFAAVSSARSARRAPRRFRPSRGHRKRRGLGQAGGRGDEAHVPEITSKRTPRAGSGIPPCEMVVATTASPPEQTAGRTPTSPARS